MNLSIIIPTFNGAWSIADATESLFLQSERLHEIIVVDDCSSDDTTTVVDRLSRSSPVPLRLIRLDLNSGGPARPINVGVSVCTGDVVLVLDQDDALAPDSLNWHLAALTAVPEATCSFTLSAAMGEPDRIFPSCELREKMRSASKRVAQHSVIDGGLMFPLFVLEGNFVRGFPGFAFRRSAWTACGPVREHLRIAADLDFLCRLTAVGPAVFIPRVGYFRREHGANLGNDRFRTELEVLKVLSEHCGRTDLRGDMVGATTVMRHRSLHGARFLGGARQYRNALSLCLTTWRLCGGTRDCVVTVVRIARYWLRYNLGALKSVLRSKVRPFCW